MQTPCKYGQAGEGQGRGQLGAERGTGTQLSTRADVLAARAAVQQCVAGGPTHPAVLVRGEAQGPDNDGGQQRERQGGEQGVFAPEEIGADVLHVVVAPAPGNCVAWVRTGVLATGLAGHPRMLPRWRRSRVQQAFATLQAVISALDVAKSVQEVRQAVEEGGLHGRPAGLHRGQKICAKQKFESVGSLGEQTQRTLELPPPPAGTGWFAPRPSSVDRFGTGYHSLGSSSASVGPVPQCTMQPTPAPWANKQPGGLPLPAVSRGEVIFGVELLGRLCWGWPRSWAASTALSCAPPLAPAAPPPGNTPAASLAQQHPPPTTPHSSLPAHPRTAPRQTTKAPWHVVTGPALTGQRVEAVIKAEPSTPRAAADYSQHEFVPARKVGQQGSAWAGRGRARE